MWLSVCGAVQKLGYRNGEGVVVQRRQCLKGLRTWRPALQEASRELTQAHKRQYRHGKAISLSLFSVHIVGRLQFFFSIQGQQLCFGREGVREGVGCIYAN